MKKINWYGSVLPKGTGIQCALCLVLLYPTQLFAQNLVVNATFDTDVNDWEAFNLQLEAQWDADDSDGDPASGSATALHDLATGGQTMLIQCIPAEPDTVYAFGGAFHLVATGAATDNAFFLLYPKASTDCGGAPNGASAIATVDVSGAWTQTSSTITTPATTQSIDFRVVIGKTGTGDVRVAADNIWMVDDAIYSDWLFNNGFETGAGWIGD